MRKILRKSRIDKEYFYLLVVFQIQNILRNMPIEKRKILRKKKAGRESQLIKT